jgi:hypothetical protein
VSSGVRPTVGGERDWESVVHSVRPAQNGNGVRVSVNKKSTHFWALYLILYNVALVLLRKQLPSLR